MEWYFRCDKCNAKVITLTPHVRFPLYCVECKFGMAKAHVLNIGLHLTIKKEK